MNDVGQLMIGLRDHFMLKRRYTTMQNFVRIIGFVVSHTNRYQMAKQFQREYAASPAAWHRPASKLID